MHAPRAAWFTFFFFFSLFGRCNGGKRAPLQNICCIHLQAFEHVTRDTRGARTEPPRQNPQSDSFREKKGRIMGIVYLFWRENPFSQSWKTGFQTPPPLPDFWRAGNMEGVSSSLSCEEDQCKLQVIRGGNITLICSREKPQGQLVRKISKKNH